MLISHWAQRRTRDAGGCAQIAGSTVTFDDGSRGDFDVIIVCTGYRIDLPFMADDLKANFVSEERNTIRLYKNVFSTAIGSSLAFIGFLQPTSGGLLTMSEIQVCLAQRALVRLQGPPADRRATNVHRQPGRARAHTHTHTRTPPRQARWFGQIIKGRCKLPSARQMERAIDADIAKVKGRFTGSSRHTIQVTGPRRAVVRADGPFPNARTRVSEAGTDPSFQADPILYTDEIAGFIGAKPTIFSHPHLAWYLLLGACGPYQYRLRGPGKWARAAEYVRKVAPPPLYKYSVLATLAPVVFFLARWALFAVYARRSTAHLH